MGASTLATMPWDTRGDSTPWDDEPRMYRKYVKQVIDLNGWIAGSAPPTRAAYGTDMGPTWQFTTADELAGRIDLPNDLDRAEPIYFQIVFASKEADSNPDFEIKHSALAPGDDIIAGATALDDTIPVTTDGAAGDDGMIRHTYVGKINANTLDSDEEFLEMYLKCVADDTADNQIEVMGLRMWYSRLLY